MTVLDGSIVTVAMPAIQSDLGFSPAGLAWVVNAYLIAFAGLLLLAGRLGDLLGRRRMFVSGLAVFTAASVLCGLSPTAGTLVAARFLQGVGGAMTSAVVLGMLVALFPEDRERTRAIAVFSASAAAGGAIGTFLGGALTATVGWHAIFLINLPIGAVALVAARRVLADDPGQGLREGADYLGAVLVTGALMLGVYTLVRTADHGWGSGRTFVLGALSLLLLAAFAVRQRYAADPLLRLGLLRSRTVTGANLVQVLMVAGMFTFQYLGALFLQRVLGLGELATGVAFLPAPVVIGVMMLGFSARLNTRFGPRPLLFGGLILIVGGLALFGRAPADGSYATDVLPVMVLLGVGFGLAMPALTGLAMAGVHPEDGGLASGLFSTTQVVGGALGLAVHAALASDRTRDLLAAGEAAGPAAGGGYRLAFLSAAGVAAAALLVAVALLRRGPSPGTARDAAEDGEDEAGATDTRDAEDSPTGSARVIS
ncbi:MFS transporter [Streptomyces liangshanensis]|uniref:MFS transporter n=1 Tax=Streptomyces liangshanensis TaxID=2717324 RepID=A0A6G9GUS2_9ACTN|nr:MFS transporter [Streptomyces liangshanensis]